MDYQHEWLNQLLGISKNSTKSSIHISIYVVCHILFLLLMAVILEYKMAHIRYTKN